MIDLRSDTVTMPSKEMKEFMFNTQLNQLYSDLKTLEEERASAERSNRR